MNVFLLVNFIFIFTLFFNSRFSFDPFYFQLSAISSFAILNDTQQAALQYVISRSAQDSKKVSSGLLARVQRLGYSEHDLNRYVHPAISMASLE